MIGKQCKSKSCWLLIIACLLFGLGSYAIRPMRTSYLEWSKANDREARLIAAENRCLTKFAQLQNLDKTDERLLKAKEELAQVYLERHLYDNAQTLYKEIWQVRSADLKHYSEAFVKAALALGELRCDVGQFSEAEYWYKLVWTYDKAHLPSNDLRIIRDLNNLGVIYYLMANSAVDSLERELELNRANYFLLEAEIAYRDAPYHPVLDQAITLDNRCLVMRELGNKIKAKSLKRQAVQLESSISIPGRIAPP